MDKVYTIETIHDRRPLSGFADFEGHPHFYQCQFDETEDDWSDQYLLKQVDANLLDKALECNAIFLRWLADFNAGLATIQTHPALPADRARYDELKALIDNQLLDLATSIRMVGHFDITSIDQPVSNVTWSAAG